MDLLWLQVADDGAYSRKDLFDERCDFASLNLHEMTAALLGNFNKSVTGHVLKQNNRITTCVLNLSNIENGLKSESNLNTVVRFVHEFKQFVDNSFEKPPMSAKKTGVLTNYVHDV